ncbi:MAG: hypothetical protein ACKOJF_29925, partial [Planctomycetaceae bacterium]
RARCWPRGEVAAVVAVPVVPLQPGAAEVDVHPPVVAVVEWARLPAVVVVVAWVLPRAAVGVVLAVPPVAARRQAVASAPLPEVAEPPPGVLVARLDPPQVLGVVLLPGPDAAIPALPPGAWVRPAWVRPRRVAVPPRPRLSPAPPRHAITRPPPSRHAPPSRHQPRLPQVALVLDWGPVVRLPPLPLPARVPAPHFPVVPRPGPARRADHCPAMTRRDWAVGEATRAACPATSPPPPHRRALLRPLRDVREGFPPLRCPPPWVDPPRRSRPSLPW